jgi:hypothetical protein
MYETRIRHLENVHADLDNRVDVMEKNNVFEDRQLSELKKRRLSVLDELRVLRRQQHEHNQRVDLDSGDR